MMWGEAAAQLAQVLPLTPLQKLIPKQSDNNIKTMPPAKVSILRKPGSTEKTHPESVEKGMSRTGVQSAQGIVEAWRGVYLTLSPPTPPHPVSNSEHFI